MNSFVFALNAVTPIILTVAIGYILKKVGLISGDLAKSLNRLVFRLALPSMLFLNVYNIEDIGDIDFSYLIYVLAVLFAVFLISVPLVIIVTKVHKRRGSLLQATFRSNFALIGIPISRALFGAEGVAVATLLSAIVIPLYNVLAVVGLSIFNDDGTKPSLKKIVLGILKNPLIQSIAAGIALLGLRAVFINSGIDFRLSDITPIFKVLGYLSDLATPLALLVLGAQFEFSAIKELRREIIFGTVMRTVAVPLIGIGLAYLLGIFTGAHFAVFVAVFATPVAVSSVPMAEAMGSDSALAGQLVIWTTLLSTVSVFVASYLLKAAGIF